MKWKYKLADISLSQLKYEFITDFEFFLKTEKNIENNTVAKHVQITGVLGLQSCARRCTDMHKIVKIKNIFFILRHFYFVAFSLFSKSGTKAADFFRLLSRVTILRTLFFVTRKKTTKRVKGLSYL